MDDSRALLSKAITMRRRADKAAHQRIAQEIEKLAENYLRLAEQARARELVDKEIRGR